MASKQVFRVEVDAAMQKLSSLGFGRNKSAIWVEGNNFYCGLSPERFKKPLLPITKGRVRKPRNSPTEQVLLGFDTEFQTSDPVSYNQIADDPSLLKNKILSYQCAAKCGDFYWEGIWCPSFEDRLTLGEFIVFALGTGLSQGLTQKIPSDIYLVAHFTRADIPAFSDFSELSWELNNIRSTFIVMGNAIPLELHFPDGEIVTLNIHLRDTLTLTPAASKSLKALGDLVGIPKIELSTDRKKAKQMIANMERVRSDHWDLFTRYAINDAKICLYYTELILEKFSVLTGKKSIPVTLTAIGVDLLLKHWKEKYGDTYSVLGKELVKDGAYDKQLGRFIVKNTDKYVETVHRQLDFATECYHGGRNEQFWFGPSYPALWNDFDLSSAYPTAMALIGRADWDHIRFTTDLDDFTSTALALAQVEFRFPESVRYPTIPVRTINGLIFPSEGVGSCGAPEIYLARQLGAELKIRWGIVVPTDENDLIFGEFIKYCIDERVKAGKKTLEGLFWKELSNSTYGKTAQGLREKRVYDLRDRKINRLPESKITQPFFAAFITSFVRAVLGEVMNSIPKNRIIFSCTTDGFLTDATDDEIQRIQKTKPLCKIYGRSQQYLTGSVNVLEKKHQVKRLLGWRTRGQATLALGDLNAEDPDFHVVLAKGGIYTRPEYEDDESQNEEIVKYFFNRTPETLITLNSKLGLRSMVELSADMVSTEFDKALSMEYDWKRNPDFVGVSKLDNHVYFTTKPWRSVQQFMDVKNLWNDFTKDERFCIKTRDEFDCFADLVRSKLGVNRDKSRYLHKKDPDIQRLRQQVCAAWQKSVAGFRCDMEQYPASRFASLLTDIGVPTQKHHVQNAKVGNFIPHSCPKTTSVMKCLNKLRDFFPDLEIDLFVPKNDSIVDFAIGKSSPLASRFSSS